MCSSDLGSYTYGEVEDYAVNVTGNAQFGAFVPAVSSSLNASLYPNPAGDRLHLDLESLQNEHITLAVYNHVGQFVRSHEINLHEGVNNLEFSTEGLSDGLYILQVQGDESAVFRFMIRR